MNIIVILNYNDYKNTLNYVDKINKFKVLNKIIVVDNCSTDNSFKELLKLKNEKIDVIRSTSNNGYSAGNNFGVKYAEEKYDVKNIFISNPDIEIKESSINKMVQFMNENDQVSVVTGVTYNGDGTLNSGFAWKVPNYKDMLLGCFFISYKVARSIFHKGIYYDCKELEYKNYIEVEVVPGCFFGIKSDVFRDVNYFDESTFLFYEENMLGSKLKTKGYKSYILCNEEIIHYESVSIKKSYNNFFKKEKIVGESAEIYMKKYLKVNKFGILFYRYLYKIGRIEVWIANILRQLMINHK